MPKPRNLSRHRSTPPDRVEPTTNRWHAAAPEEPCALYLAGSDAKIGENERKDLIARVRAGEVVELELEAVTYIQRDTPNRNFVRFQPGILPTLAKSFEGQPVLRDHSTYSQADRGGTIVKSKLEHNEDGSKQMRMRMKLVKPWAVESALDGTLDRFSIGWQRTAPSNCSIHGAPWTACDCWPGDKMADGRVMELVLTGADGTEVSGVNVPAVVGTRIESISQLEAIDPGLLADILASHTTSGDRDHMKILPALLACLALPATATEEDALAAVEDRCDRLKIAEAKSTATESRLAAIEVESATRARADRLAIVEAGIGKLIAAGKLKPGSETEAALRRQGGVTTKEGQLTVDMKRDVEVFAASVADLLAVGPVMTAAGAVLPALQVDPAPHAPKDGKAFLAAAPVAASWLKSAGISEADFEKHGSNGREIVGVLGQ